MFETSAIETAVEILLDHSEIIETSHQLETGSRDPKDNPILECAVSGRAAFIIIGDKDLLQLNPFRSIHILTPKDFLDAFSKH